jgi:hypothetical protein
MVETKTPFFIFAKSDNKPKFAHFAQNFEIFHEKFSFLPIFLKIFLCSSAKKEIFSNEF